MGNASCWVTIATENQKFTIRLETPTVNFLNVSGQNIHGFPACSRVAELLYYWHKNEYKIDQMGNVKCPNLCDPLLETPSLIVLTFKAKQYI